MVNLLEAGVVEASSGPWPYIIGGGTLLFLLVLLLITVAIGGGREHS